MGIKITYTNDKGNTLATGEARTLVAATAEARKKYGSKWQWQKDSQGEYTGGFSTSGVSAQFETVEGLVVSKKRATKAKASKPAKAKKAKTAYQARIEKALAGFIVKTPLDMIRFRMEAEEKGGKLFGSDEFAQLEGMRYGHTDCDMCGFRGIRRIFTIKAEATGKKLEVGIECIKNWVDADIVEGMAKKLEERFGVERNKVEFADTMTKMAEAIVLGRKHGYDLARNPYLRSAMAARGVWPTSDMVNRGNPASVLNKLERGKRPGKKEKEVIAVWTKALDNLEMEMAEFDANREYYERGVHFARGFGRWMRMVWFDMDHMTRRNWDGLATAA